MYKYITYSIANRKAFITLNRPEKRNAFNFELVAELKLALTDATNEPKVKVVILKANGKVFSAGADLQYLEQLQSNTFEENLADSNHLKELFYQIYTLPKMVIAQIQGHAIAGGCGLATVCDFSFAVPEAKFGYTEVKIGFIPAIVKVFLLRKIGEGKTRELLLTGKLITADEALKLGLINFVENNDVIEGAVEKFANGIINEVSEQSIALTKQMIAEVQAMSLEDGLNYAAKMNAKARATVDCAKGIGAFLNKQKINW